MELPRTGLPALTPTLSLQGEGARAARPSDTPHAPSCYARRMPAPSTAAAGTTHAGARGFICASPATSATATRAQAQALVNCGIAIAARQGADLGIGSADAQHDHGTESEGSECRLAQPCRRNTER